jgi:ribosomal protein L21
LITDEKKLSKYSVNFELLDEKKSKKLNIFTYKNKSGIRRKLGYREDIKIVKVKSISTGKGEEEE